jgi:hypothetical protein
MEKSRREIGVSAGIVVGRLQPRPSGPLSPKSHTPREKYEWEEAAPRHDDLQDSPGLGGLSLILLCM